MVAYLLPELRDREALLLKGYSSGPDVFPPLPASLNPKPYSRRNRKGISTLRASPGATKKTSGR